jgi:RimJ/RimL family protein N-acetyltransferase
MAFNQSDRDFTIRLANESDCRAVWELANDPVVRRASFSSEAIPWESHVQWFKTKLLDAHCLFYVAEDDASPFIGQVRYEIEDKQAVVSIALTAGYRGKGYASLILYQSARNVFERAAAEIIRAYIKPDNASSLRAFTKAGFTGGESAYVRGNQALGFVLRRPREYAGK